MRPEINNKALPEISSPPGIHSPEVHYAFSKPPRPNPIYARVGNGRGGNSPPLPPRAPIKNPGNRGQQYIAPVEMRRTFIEMRKPKQQRRDNQRRQPHHTPLQKILQPSAKKKFFRHRNKQEDSDPGQSGLPQCRHIRMRMNKSQRQSQQ